MLQLGNRRADFYASILLGRPFECMRRHSVVIHNIGCRVYSIRTLKRDIRVSRVTHGVEAAAVTRVMFAHLFFGPLIAIMFGYVKEYETY